MPVYGEGMRTRRAVMSSVVIVLVLGIIGALNPSHALPRVLPRGGGVDQSLLAVPDVPGDLHTSSPSTTCSGQSDAPSISDNTPILRAVVSSPSDQLLRALFQWQFDAGSGFGTPSQAVTAFAAAGQRSLALDELDDGLWRWRARAEGELLRSAWSSWCYLRIDTVPPGDPVVHGWMLNEDTAGKAPDLPGRDLPLSFASDVTWDAGNRAEFGEQWDRALRFDGTGAGAHTSGAAFLTTGSFSVMAKVRLDELNPSDEFKAVSQDGSADSTINLGLRAGRWTAWGVDDDGAAFTVAGSAPIDQVGPGGLPFPDGLPDWQHLAAVYDASAGQIQLYIDGNLAAAADFSYGATVDGSLRVGRGLAGGEFTGSASGRVDDVIATNAALPAAAVRTLLGAETAADVAGG